MMALDVTEVECVSCWACSPHTAHVPLIEFVDVPGASSAKRSSKCAKQISVLHTSIRTCMAMVSKSSASLTAMLVSYLDLLGSMSMRICQRRHMDTFYRAQLECIQYIETILYSEGIWLGHVPMQTIMFAARHRRLRPPCPQATMSAGHETPRELPFGVVHCAGGRLEHISPVWSLASRSMGSHD